MIWKDVLGFEGFYKVNDAGDVMTIATCFRSSKPGKILKPTIQKKTGYAIVRLWRDKKPHAKYVHRIVAEAFLGPCPSGYEVNHKHEDGNRTRNNIGNLEYLTRSENNLHSYRVLGRKAAPTYGEKHHKAKLNWSLVDEIRKEFELVRSYAKLAKKYKVDWTTIKAVVLKETWKEEFRYENST